MTYIEGCKIAEEIINAGDCQLIGRDVEKHTKAGVGYVVTKYNGTFQSVNLTNGTEFYLNHKSKVCEVREARTARVEAAESAQTVASSVDTEAAKLAAAPLGTAIVGASSVSSEAEAAGTVVSATETSVVESVVSSSEAEAAESVAMPLAAAAVGSVAISAGTAIAGSVISSDTPATESVKPGFTIVKNTVSESSALTKEKIMNEQNTTIDPALAAEYSEVTAQLNAALNAFLSRLESDKQVSEQALRNFIENPLDSKTISYHAARLSYTKEMLDQLHKVAELIPH